MTTPTPILPTRMYEMAKQAGAYAPEILPENNRLFLSEFMRLVESEVNARWQKMLGDGEAVWYACDTEGTEFDVTFVTTREEAADAVDCALADDPELKFEDLVTPLFTHPAPDHTTLLQDVARVLEENWSNTAIMLAGQTLTLSDEAAECVRKQVDIYKRIKEALK